MFTRRDTFIATIVFSLTIASAANAGQAKPAAGGAKPGGAAGEEKASAPAEPCQTNGVINASNQVNATATSVGKTADTLGKTADTVGATSDKLDTMETKMNKVFAGFKPGAKTTPPPAAKPAATTTTATATPPAKPPAAKPPAKPATPATPVAAATTNATSAVTNAQGAVAGVPGAAGASGGGGSAPCAPANKVVAGGIGGTPVAIAAPPTFTSMPDGDYMLGYVAPGGKQPTYAKVKQVQNPAQATPTYPRDGVYSDGKMYYMVSDGKLILAPMASGGGGGAGGAGSGGGEAKAVAPAAAPAPAAVAPAAAAPVAGPASGLVADITGSDMIVNIGTSTGLKVGSTLDVVRPRVIKDPATGKELKTVDTRLGTLVVTSADATSASGKYTGTATKVGDTVRVPQ